MARRLRVEYEGAIYHVTIRGVERRRLFDDDADRERFLKRLGEAVEEYGVRLYLYCLMSNHVHLLLETPQANLSVFMQKLQTAYTVYYNLRHRRAGHLTQGRFVAKPVDGDSYLLKLSRYIHLNPVYVGGVAARPVNERMKKLREYRWSSYRGYAGLGQQPGFVCEGPVLAHVAGAEKDRRREYRRFVEAGLAQKDNEMLEVLKGGGWGVGEKDFQDRIRDIHIDMAGKRKRIEDVSYRRAGRLYEPKVILKVVARSFGVEVGSLRQRRYNCVARGVVAYLLGKYAGMNQRDIGAWLGMGTGAAVSAQLKRLRVLEERDTELVSRIEDLSTEVVGGGAHAARGQVRRQ